MRARLLARQQLVGVFVSSSDNEIHGRKKARKERAVTFDEMVRVALVGASIPVYSWLFKKAQAYLSTRRNETGRCLEQRLAYSLGRAWARRYRRT